MLKKSKLQKEYEEITQYLKKREELKKKERYIEESISSRNGIIDEVLINDIKDENALYFSLLDMKCEEEKSLSNSKEMYLNKRELFEDLLFIEDLSNEEKNAFMKAVMERERIAQTKTATKRTDFLCEFIKLIVFFTKGFSRVSSTSASMSNFPKIWVHHP